MEAPKKETKKSAQKVSFSFLKILTGSDLSRRLSPFMVAESKNAGPVVWLTGAAHGDEVDGIVVIQEIFKRIRKEPLLKGSLYAFPLMNPLGFEMVSRHITLSEEDLNRSFPGSEKGSIAERIAHQIFTTIIGTKPTIVMDLHSSWRGSIPYALIDIEEGIINKDTYEKTKFFGEKSGLPIVFESEKLEKSLTFNLINSGIPAVTLELGESYVVHEKNVEYGVKSVLNILSYLEMIKPIGETFFYPMSDAVKDKILKYCDQPFSSSSGIIRFLVKPGDFAKKDQPLAKIYNVFGKLQETISASDDCVILGYSDFSVAFPGSLVIVFGIIQPKQ